MDSRGRALRIFSGISDSGSPQIPLESEGTAVLPIPRDFIPSAPQGQRKKTRVFLPFRRNGRKRRKERSKIFLSSNRKDVFPDPFGSEKNTRRAKKTRRTSKFSEFGRSASPQEILHVEEILVFIPSAPAGQRKKTRT